MEQFAMSAQFITGGSAGLILGFLVGKVVGAAKKARDLRRRMGV